MTAAGNVLGLPSRRLVAGRRTSPGLWLLGAGLVVIDWAYLVWRGV